MDKWPSKIQWHDFFGVKLQMPKLISQVLKMLIFYEWLPLCTSTSLEKLVGINLTSPKQCLVISKQCFYNYCCVIAYFNKRIFCYIYNCLGFTCISRLPTLCDIIRVRSWAKSVRTIFISLYKLVPPKVLCHE